MIRTIVVAAAAAAVGYTLGQRAVESPESRFERDRPTESGLAFAHTSITVISHAGPTVGPTSSTLTGGSANERDRR